MKCSNCGVELAEDAKFCSACNTAADIQETVIEEPVVTAEATETTETPKAVKENPLNKVKAAMAAFTAKIQPIFAPVVEKCKPFVEKNKLYLAGGACLLILLLTVLVVVSACNTGNGFTAFTQNIIVETNGDDQVILIIDNKKPVKTGLEAKYIDEVQSNIDGTVCAFLTGEGQLAVARGKKVTVVANDVEEFILSVTGEGLVYVVEDEDGNATLKLNKVGKKKSTTIISDFNYSRYDISPDGKSVAYFKYNEDNDTSSLMYFKGSKHTKITSNDVKLVGLSNKGKQIYVTAEDEESGDTILFSYNTRGNKRKLGTCNTIGYLFNEDHTQILFFEGSSMTMQLKTYVSNKGKEAVRISSSMAVPMIPTNSVMSENGRGVTVPTETLFNKVYSCYKDGQYNAWFIKKNPDKNSKLASNISSNAVLDQSAEYLYFTDKDSDLKVLKVSHGDRASDKAKLIAEDVKRFVVTSDRAKVYFISEDSLYSCNGKTGKGKKTIANEGLGSTLVLNQKDICYYFVDGDVYACSNGKRGKLVVAEADDMDVSANGIVYVETEDAYFATKTAKKPAKIYTFD